MYLYALKSTQLDSEETGYHFKRESLSLKFPDQENDYAG